MSKFKQFWKEQYEKSEALTWKQMLEVRKIIVDGLKLGISDTAIMDELSNRFKKLQDRSRLETVFYTESHRYRTKELKRQAKREGVVKFKIDIRGDTCPLCRKFTNNGKKIFTKEELVVDGRSVPPIHPRCLCVIIPVKD